MNKYLVIPLYRIYLLPLFGLGRIFLLLTTKGRKTGKKRRTPLEYHRIEGVITVISGRGDDAGWMKNLKKNPDDIYIRVGFHSFKPRVEFITDEKEKLEMIKWYIKNHAKSAKFLFGWHPKKDDPETTDFSYLLNLISIVKFHKKSH